MKSQQLIIILQYNKTKTAQTQIPNSPIQQRQQQQMNEQNIYVTETKQQHKQPSKDNKMQDYVQNISRKIDSAKWKQNVILTYNYMPLQIAKDKIQNQMKLYQKRIEQLQAKLFVQTQQQFIQNQVEIFKEFGGKLYSKIKQIQQQIQLLNMEMDVVRAAIHDKRANLKMMLKQNVQLNKLIIQHRQKQKNKYRMQQLQIQRQIQAEQQRQSLQNMKRTSTQKTLLQLTSRVPSISVRTNSKNLLTRKQTSRSQNNTQLSINQKLSSNTNNTNVSYHYSSRDLYEECVETIIKSLKKMNKSEDVQQGIYLQIMNRKILTKAPTYSLKSKTCDVLMDRYRDLKNNKNSMAKINQDFNMSFQTFMNLNWKQIMGIILVKDRNASKFRQLLKFYQINC